MKFVRPDKSGIIAFGIVLMGALLQVAKEISDARSEVKEMELVQKAKEQANARAAWGLERLCNTVNFMLQWMAAESKVAYPCQEDEIPNWYYVHSLYRTNLIRYWCSRKAFFMEQNDEEDYGNTWVMLKSWKGQLDAEVATLEMNNELIASETMMIRKIQRQIESNWGMSDLSEKQRSDPRRLMEQVRQALQEVVDATEFIYPTLKKEEYSKGRQHCAEVQDRGYPNKHYTDLVFLAQDRRGTIPPADSLTKGE